MDDGRIKKVAPQSLTMAQLTVREIIELTQHTDLIRDVCFTAGDVYLISVADDCMANVWSIDKRKLIETLTEHGTVAPRRCASAVSGNVFATGDVKGLLIVWNTTPSRQVICKRKLAGEILALLFIVNEAQQDVLMVGRGDGVIGLYQGDNLDPIREVKLTISPIITLAKHPHEDIFVAGCGQTDAVHGPPVIVFDLDFHATKAMKGHQSHVRGAVWMTNELIVSASLDRTLRVFNTITYKQQRIVPMFGTIWSLDIAHDRSLLAAGLHNGEVALYHVPELDNLKLFTLHNNAAVNSLCFSPISPMLATVADDGKVNLLFFG